MNEPRFLANGTAQAVLPAVRQALTGADEAILCCAFVDTRGVLLIEKELRHLGEAGRLVATTTFGGDKALAALSGAAGLGVRCRVLNPPRGTFHPKVVLARHGTEHVAVVGSANLTSGLVVNAEAAVVLAGELPEVLAITSAWWDTAVALEDLVVRRERDVLEAELWALLRAHVRTGDVVETVSEKRPNHVVAVDRTGLLVETEKSRTRGTGPQLIEPRMIQLAWDVLTAEGQVTNSRLLDELRVHRSSFVCALLARLPMVEVARTRPITLRLVAPVDGVTAAADPPGEYG